MKWRIVTDSSCDAMPDVQWPAGVSYGKVPFVFHIGDAEMTDNEHLDIPAMLTAMEQCPNASRSACPAPGIWEEQFEQADQVIALTISANLSGSYESAIAAREMTLEKHPDKKICILNSLSTGPVLNMTVEKALALIRKGFDFDNVSAALTDYIRSLHTIFALCSFNNLVKNGRVSRLAGLIAGKLGIWGIGAGDSEGRIVMVSKVRGSRKIIQTIVDNMKQNHFAGGPVTISHCLNLEFASQLKEGITQIWRNAQVYLRETGGLCSFYAERHGLIVAY